MNLDLEKNEALVIPKKGDILVFQNIEMARSGRIMKSYFLILEDKPRCNFTLLNLNNNNLMSSLFEESVRNLIKKSKTSFKTLEFLEVISSKDFKLVRQENTI